MGFTCAKFVILKMEKPAVNKHFYMFCMKLLIVVNVSGGRQIAEAISGYTIR